MVNIEEILNTKNLKNVLLSVTGIMILFICAIMFSWLYGFWSNGLNDTHFELNSCWTGLAAIASGLVTVGGFVGTALFKHYTDSKFNSKEGETP